MLNKKYIPENILKIGILTILVLLPFHAFFTTWFGSNFGYFDVVRLWKEAILLALTMASFWLLARDKKNLRSFADSKIVRAAFVYLMFLVVMTIWGLVDGNVGIEASAYGLAINARYLVFMLICMVFVSNSKYRVNINKIVLVPALVVVVFGLLQLLLPPDFLKHFGYGKDTIVAYQTVDNKPEIVRLQSTLRGPNPLGAYLVVVSLLLISKYRKSIRYIVPATLALLLVFYNTYSRSAWIGLAVALVAYLLLIIKKEYRKKVVSISFVVAITSVSTILLLRNNDFIQNTVFHTNEKSTSSISSNEARFNSINNSINSIKRNPIGEGVGVAGPASLRNNKRASNITENYFLQLGIEVGIVGLGLFLAVLFLVAVSLKSMNGRGYSYELLALLLGLAVVNMVSHAWADDTLAYIFFGLVGLNLGLKNSTKSENKSV